MGGCQDDWLAALLLEERCGGGLQNEFGALNALVLVTLREEQKQGPGTAIGEEGGHTREVDQVPEVRDGNGRVRQMERKRRKRSRRQNMREDHRDDWRRGERERKMLVPLLDPRDTQ